MNKRLNKVHIDSILRVDHAGETAAAKIYDGQLAILKNTPLGPTIKNMKNKSKKNHIDSILRVDHAGETAAAKIYDGQLAVLKNTSVGPTIQHMKDQEQEHLDTFNQLLF